MRGYSVGGGLTESSVGPKTAATIIATSAVRPAVYEVWVGCATAPVDYSIKALVARFTAAGTAASSPTPEPNDPGDVASISTAGITHSAEPTYTSGKTLLMIPFNARNTVRWVAYQPGKEFIAPATAANGIGIKNLLASAALVMDASVCFAE